MDGCSNDSVIRLAHAAFRDKFCCLSAVVVSVF